MTEATKDAIARIVFTAGGIGVVIAVAGIVVGIAVQALPLFSRTPVSAAERLELDEPPAIAGLLRSDATPWTLAPDGSVGLAGEDATVRVLPDGESVLDAAVLDGRRLVVAGSRGTVVIGAFEHSGRPGEPGLGFEVEARRRLDFEAEDSDRLAAARAWDGRVLLALWNPTELRPSSWDPVSGAWRTFSPIPANDLRAAAISEELDHIALVEGRTVTVLAWPSRVPVDFLGHSAPADRVAFLHGGRRLVVASREGVVQVVQQIPRLLLENTGTEPVEVGALRVVPGGIAVVEGPAPRPRPGLDVRRFDPVWRVVARHEDPGRDVAAVVPLPRGRTFAVLSDANRVTLYNATAGRRLRTDVWPVRRLGAVTAGREGRSLVAVDPAGSVTWRRYGLDHAAVTLSTLFAPTWYEGEPAPSRSWQPTGGVEGEPRFSLWPLLFGTLKATVYAMLVSVPLALLSALYVSQLAPRWLKPVVKPAVEVMAAVPTVIVGFLGALWLAPMLERHLVEVAAAGLAAPTAGVAAIGVFRLIPERRRLVVPRTVEFGCVLLAVAASVWIAWTVAPALEARLFSGDAIRWIWENTGLHYEQRNGLVVGLALGFAVVPVIFTIADDAFEAVPGSLVSGARALGATRWQVARHLLIPAAAPGLFAAVMLGFGRAVGETMIVLMVAGNTALVHLSPFDGMRALSATLAMEVPGAAVGSTHLRILFLAGTLLFLITFLVTTLAGLVTRELRLKYVRV